MHIFHQPYDGQLGILLLDRLGAGAYTDLVMCVAFAKTSGVKHVRPALELFGEVGGKITAFVGVDHDGTSYEALLSLFEVCDELYVVHTESAYQTFHPKIYALSGGEKTWTAVGSNNLTAGGLWGNFEAFAVSEHAGQSNEAIVAMVRRFTTDQVGVCMLITSNEDLLSLIEDGYIRKEADLRIRVNSGSAARKKSKRFATSVSAPIPKEPLGKPTTARSSSAQASPGAAGSSGQNHTGPTEAPISEPAVKQRDAGIVWFETKAMTGASRNILDLSMTARIESGSPEGTRFESPLPAMSLGSIAFFDVNPRDTTVEKNITVNFNGSDYYPCTIKLDTGSKRPNGSWRIQLRGVRGDGLALQTAVSDFTHKVITLQEIGPDRYALDVYGEHMLPELRDASVFVARNGKSGRTKLFGLL